MPIRCPQIKIQGQGDNYLVNITGNDFQVIIVQWQVPIAYKTSVANSQGQHKYHPKVCACVVSVCEQLAI